MLRHTNEDDHRKGDLSSTCRQVSANCKLSTVISRARADPRRHLVHMGIPMNSVARLIVLIPGLLLALPSLADTVDPERILALVARGDILPLEQILKLNESALAGRIVEVELELKRDGYLYEIKVLKPDGRYREIEIDARTGNIARSK